MKFACVLVFMLYCSLGVNGAIEMDDPKPVTSMLRKSVTMPCKFRVKPPKEFASATVIWWKEQPYAVPPLYTCSRKADLSGNCTRSAERYSFGGNLTERNIALRINNVTHKDAGLYYCRIELETKENWFTSKEIKLKVKEPQELRRIYIQTTVTGESWVTCEVSGEPPPNVIWTEPENVTMSQMSSMTNCLASYSLPVSPNTNYTCQIDGDDGRAAQSIFYQESLCATVCHYHIYQAMIGGLGAILGIVLIINMYVLAAWRHKASANKSAKDTNNIYNNCPDVPAIDPIYMNARKTAHTS